MLVVSDTNPITNLAAIGRLSLLHDVYGQITIPKDVRDELVLGGQGNNPGAREVETESWFTVVGVGVRRRSQIARDFASRTRPMSMRCDKLASEAPHDYAPVPPDQLV